MFGEVIDTYASAFKETGLAQAYLDVNSGPARDMRNAIISRDPERIRATWGDDHGITSG